MKKIILACAFLFFSSCSEDKVLTTTARMLPTPTPAPISRSRTPESTSGSVKLLRTKFWLVLNSKPSKSVRQNYPELVRSRIGSHEEKPEQLRFTLSYSTDPNAGNLFHHRVFPNSSSRAKAFKPTPPTIFASPPILRKGIRGILPVNRVF